MKVIVVINHGAVEIQYGGFLLLQYLLWLNQFPFHELFINLISSTCETI
ncbi:hypothetical protein [Desulfurobacterium crinifex]